MDNEKLKTTDLADVLESVQFAISWLYYSTVRLSMTLIVRPTIGPRFFAGEAPYVGLCPSDGDWPQETLIWAHPYSWGPMEGRQ